MESGSEATLEEEREEVLASVQDAMRTGGRDPDLAAAAGFLLLHLAGANVRVDLAKLARLAAGGAIQFIQQRR